jgi:hypothetical protein
MMSESGRVDPDGIEFWIAEHLAIDRRTVAAVLKVEFEYMIGIGIARPERPDDVDYQFEFYDPVDLLREPPRYVDCERISEDVEGFLGIAAELANCVLNAELEYLQMRGLA